MKTVNLENIVQLTLTEDQSAKMCVVDDFYAEEIQNALQKITTLNVNASKDFMQTAKFAGKLNVKQIMTAATINGVKTICVRLFV
jgi:hypothetical protein